MRLLFIPSIQQGNWEALYIKAGIILFFWFCMIIAVLIDLWSGVERAKAVGEKPRSDKFRRTISKIGDYWRVLAFALMLDVIASILPFYTLPYASVLAAIACVLIEGKSVLENLKLKKSVAAEIPELVDQLIQCIVREPGKEPDKEQILELIKKFNTLGDKHHENK